MHMHIYINKKIFVQAVFFIKSLSQTGFSIKKQLLKKISIKKLPQTGLIVKKKSQTGLALDKFITNMIFYRNVCPKFDILYKLEILSTIAIQI